MTKWWIEREGENFDHVSADLLEVEAGALVFKRQQPRQANSMYVGEMPLIPVLIVAPGTYVSVVLDEDNMREIFAS